MRKVLLLRLMSTEGKKPSNREHESELNKKLLILSNTTISLYRFRKELIQALVACRWEVYVSTPDDGFYQELRTLGVHIIVTSFDRHSTNPFHDFIMLLRYRAILRDVKPDIVLSYAIKPNIYGNLALRKFSMPVINTVTGLGEAFIRRGMLNWIVKRLYTVAFRRTSGIIFQNNEDEDVFRTNKIIKSQRTIRVPGSGVNLNEYSDMDYPDSTLVSFLYFGRITRSKGISELIEATMELLHDFSGEFETIVLGFHEGDMVAETMTAVNNGIIRYIEFQKDITPYIKAAHCVVLPSYKEGMSNSLLEAAAAGRPLITSDVSGCREIVDDGINGYLCTARDSNSLYDCMKRFLSLSNEERLQMGAASRKKVEAEFDRKIVTTRMLDLVTLLTSRCAGFKS